MTARTSERLTDFSGLIPGKGVLGVKADEVLYKNTLVARDSSNRAVEPTDGDGLPVLGVAGSTYDATDLSDNEINAELKYGIFTFAYTGSAPKTGDILYSVDNQTVSTSAGSGRGVAGVCTEKVDATNCNVFVGPGVPSIATVFGTDLADVDALMASEQTAQAVINLPLASFRANDGTAIPAFSNGVADGIEYTGGEALTLRINNAATFAVKYVTSVELPNDLDDAQAVVVHMLASKSGATVGDATIVTCEAFFQTVGALYDASSDAGGDSSALVGNATAKTVAEITKSIASSAVPAAPCTLTLSLKVKNGTLGTDDLFIHSVWLEYTKKLLTS